jgi:signal transduction histidine kinase
MNEEPAVSYFEELTRLNNELVNMQRELAKKNHELDELNKLKNEFLGIAAHDLRNPLGIIMGYSSSLLDESEGVLSDIQKMMLESILKSSEFMLGLLHDLLDISAIESGKVKLVLVKADLVPLVRKNVELNSVIAHKKNIHINCSSHGKIPEVQFDKSKIEQVLNNLISNAVKFSKPQTDINVNIFLDHLDVTVSVADNGQGIPYTEQKLLFKPFEKLSVKSTAGEHSTGLGLSIVRNIIVAHGGKIWVKSEEGRGSTFYFSLPSQTYVAPDN